MFWKIVKAPQKVRDGRLSDRHHNSQGEITMIHSRTIREAAAYFREADPHTGLTETAIRRLLRQGLVPSVRVGRKYLVTIEALEAYLASDAEKARENPKQTAKKWQIQ